MNPTLRSRCCQTGNRFLCLVLLVVTFGSVPLSARTVEETVRLALEANPDILVQEIRQRIESEQLKYVEADFLPKLSLALGIGREDSNNASTRASNGGGSEEMERRESSVTLSQMLFDGFETHWEKNSQETSLEAVEYELRDVMSQVALTAIESHLALAQANLVHQANRRNLEAHERIAEDVSQRVESGKDDRAKMNQIRSRLALSMSNVEAARNAVMDAGASYRQAVGREPDDALSFQSGLFGLPGNLTALWESVNQANPALNAARAAQRAARAQSKASQSTDLPSLYLESGASWNDNLDGISGRNSDAFVMLRMRYDLFQGGARQARKRQAMLRVEQSQAETDVLLRELRRDVETVWNQYQTGSRRLGLLQDYVESAELTREAYTKQFNIGQRNLIDLLDAENEVLSARRLLADARQALYLSKYQILHLQGRLLDHGLIARK